MPTNTEQDVIEGALLEHLEPLTKRAKALQFLFERVTKHPLISTAEHAIEAYRVVIKKLNEAFPKVGYNDWYPGDGETKAGDKWPETRLAIVRAMEPATGRD